MPRIFLPTCCFALVLVAGCTTQSEVVSFNDAIADSSRELDRPAFQLGTVFQEYGMGQTVDLNAVRKHYDALIAALDTIEEELTTVSVPDDPTCREFHVAMTEFMAHQREVVETEFKDLVETIEAKNPGDAESRQKVLAWLESPNTTEENLHRVAQETQRAMAKKFNFLIQEESPQF